MTSFSDLGLAGPILQALAEQRHETPTPIQADAIPVILSGRDLLGIAQTGTGKTAAFALPILQHLALERRAPKRRTARVLVLAPTRELCGQIQERFEAYGRHVGVRTGLVIGGVPMGRQIRQVGQGLDILIATPGRLLDLAEQRAVDFAEVEVFVLDEADQMLDMGFIHAIRAIVAKLPAERRNLFFSATMPPPIAKLAGQILNEPVTVAVTPVAKTADRIAQEVLHVDPAVKAKTLTHVLSGGTVTRALVFARTKHGADKVVRGLDRDGIAAAAIHGNKSQPQRERTLAGFRDGSIKVLVATDIAARGIDVEQISHVVNYDLPNVPETYVHRIGRTARAGADGIAISICIPEERAYLKAIEKLIKLAVPVGEAPFASERPARPAPAEDRADTDARPERRPRGDRQRPAGGQSARADGPRAEGKRGKPGSRGPGRPAPRAPEEHARPQRRPEHAEAEVGLGGVSFLSGKAKPAPRHHPKSSASGALDAKGGAPGKSRNGRNRRRRFGGPGGREPARENRA